MTEYREDIRPEAEVGRNPDDLKVLFLVQPVLGDTDREAEDGTNACRGDRDSSTRSSGCRI